MLILFFYSEPKVPEEKVQPAVTKGTKTTRTTSHIIIFGDRQSTLYVSGAFSLNMHWNICQALSQTNI